MLSETVSYPAAFLAGLLSFLSPCILPLIPAYFTFITGFSLEQLTGAGHEKIRKSVISSTIAYVLGFSFVFVLMGASASFLGSLMKAYQDVIRIAGGVLIIVLGVHLTGLFRLRFLEIEKRVDVKRRPLHTFGTFLIGMAFGAGWSPCIGPLLGSILAVAASRQTVGEGVVLLGIYSAGLAIPFILISLFVNFLLTFIRKANKIIPYVNLAAGIILILMGLILLTDRLYLLSSLG